MHTGFSVDFDHAWLSGRDFPRERGRTLLRLLAELARSGSLREAARKVGVSYRSAWGALSDGAQSLFPAQFDRLMAELRIIAPAIGRSICLEAVARRGWAR